MSILLKIKFDPRRGGLTPYDFFSLALRVDNWSVPLLSVLESTDDHVYTPLQEDVEWRADFDYDSSRIRVHLLKNYSTIIYIILASADARNIPAACSIEGALNLNIPASFNAESPRRINIPVAWNTGAALKRNIPAAYHIEAARQLNIPAAYNQKNIRSRNIPAACGISGAIGILIPVSFRIGSLDSRNIPAAAWIMGVAIMPADAVILPQHAGPAASRVKGCTTKLTMTGTEWEELD